MTNASIIRHCQSIRANCSLLVNRQGNPLPMAVEDRKTRILHMEEACAAMDNGNREAWSDSALEDMAAESNICETVRYYREQADNYMAEVG